MSRGRDKTEARPVQDRSLAELLPAIGRVRRSGPAAGRSDFTETDVTPALA